jgi:hypothetical protein
MGDNEFSQYSSASHRHSASLGFHPLGEAAAMYSGLSGSAEVSPNRPFAETSADWTVRCTSLTVDLGYSFRLPARLLESHAPE